MTPEERIETMWHQLDQIINQMHQQTKENSGRELYLIADIIYTITMRLAEIQRTMEEQ